MTVLKYIAAWFGMMVLAIINGGLRDWGYAPHVGDLRAHQLSTLILVVLFAGYFRLLTAVWPLKSAGQAWRIGGLWLLMTVAFEFGLGRVAGKPWSELFHAYNLGAGQVWMFIPLFVLVGPYLFFRFGQGR